MTYRVSRAVHVTAPCRDAARRTGAITGSCSWTCPAVHCLPPCSVRLPLRTAISSMPPMLNSSASTAHARTPPSSPRVHKLDMDARDHSRKDLGHVLLASLQQRVNLKSLHSLFSCAGIGETEPFNLPPQHRMLVRMKTNANYFLTNYVLFTVGVFAFLLMFFHPIQLLVCIVVAYGWHVFLTKKEIPTDKFQVFGRRLSEQDILLAATGSTMVFLLFFVLPTVIFALSVSSLASATHALLRNNRLKDDSFDARQGPAAPTEVEELV